MLGKIVKYKPFSAANIFHKLLYRVKITTNPPPITNKKLKIVIIHSQNIVTDKKKPPEALVNKGFRELFVLFPLNCSWWFGGYIIDNTIYMLYFISYTV